jgi:hypothetical protein
MNILKEGSAASTSSGRKNSNFSDEHAASIFRIDESFVYPEDGSAGSPKHWCLSTRLQGVTSQKTAVFMYNIVFQILLKILSGIENYSLLRILESKIWKLSYSWLSTENTE